jgi:hypothetical protein
METEGSLLSLKKLATVPYPEPDDSNPHPQNLFPSDTF